MENNTAKARVEIEIEDLNTKMKKLLDFLAGTKAQELSRVSYELLCLQFTTMKTYASILSKRLYYWDDPKTSTE